VKKKKVELLFLNGDIEVIVTREESFILTTFALQQLQPVFW